MASALCVGLTSRRRQKALCCRVTGKNCPRLGQTTCACGVLGFAAPKEPSGPCNFNMHSLTFVLVQDEEQLRKQSADSARRVALTFMIDLQIADADIPPGIAPVIMDKWLRCGPLEGEDAVFTGTEHKGDFCGKALHNECCGLLKPPIEKSRRMRIACLLYH